jgi:hypothetical protein
MTSLSAHCVGQVRLEQAMSRGVKLGKYRYTPPVHGVYRKHNPKRLATD